MGSGNAPFRPGPDVVRASPEGGAILRRTLQDGSGDPYVIYRPDGSVSDAPFVVLIHDAARDPDALIDAFLEPARRHGAVLIAPCFSQESYPSYQRLGRRRSADERGRRAGATLDAMVDEVAARLGVARPAIHLFGYGAGARFALRYALAHPDGVAAVAIAEAETYTFPDPERRFPRGIAPPHPESDLSFDPERFLAVPMTVFEARAAGAPAPPGGAPRRRVRAARAAGTRERNGRNWVAAMQTAALERRLVSRIAYRELEGPPASAALARGAALPGQAFEALLGGSTELDASTASEDASERRRERRRRTALIGLATLAGVAALAPVLLWAHYRSTHVISRDAVVRGHIAEVGARLEGIIASVEVEAGDRVRAGQVVARLHDHHFRARSEEARSKLEKATRELHVERLAIANERRRLESTLHRASAGLSAAAAAVRAAESRVAGAHRRMELQRTMAARGLVSEEQLRQAETEHRTATALLSASRAEQTAAAASEELAHVDSAGLSVREERISVLESEIAAFRAELALADVNLDGAIIRAPGDGAVVRRIVEPGSSTVVGAPILSIWVGDQTWVEAWIDERQLAHIEVGGRATVTFSSHRDREFSGVVESIGVSTDFELPDSDVPQPRRERMRDAPVIAIRIRLDDPTTDLRPGLSAVVGIRKKAD